MNTISFPNMFNVNSGVLSTNLSYSYKSIHESLTSLFMTSPGELLGDPAYGCRIRHELFNVKSDININELKDIIITAINKYLPQLIISTNDIKIYSNANDNRYKIVIYYKLNFTSENQIFELIL